MPIGSTWISPPSPCKASSKPTLNWKKAATRIAASAATPEGAGLDTVELSVEVIALMSAKNAFSANLKTLKAADEIQDSVIDRMA
jgi:flagellar hook protein FlgE